VRYRQLRQIETALALARWTVLATL
jgi:hypothetical protein